MKVIYPFIFGLFFLSSCQLGTQENSPENTARAWLSALQQSRFDEMEDISSGDILDYVQEMMAFTEGITFENPTSSIQVKDMECKKIDDNHAKCEYCCHDQEKERLSLILEEGIWKVATVEAHISDEILEGKSYEKQLNRNFKHRIK